MVDALYFTTAILTTVGYGDLSPSSDLSRAFTGVFVCVGIGMIGLALGVVGSYLVEQREKALMQALEAQTGGEEGEGGGGEGGQAAGDAGGPRIASGRSAEGPRAGREEDEAAKRGMGMHAGRRIARGVKRASSGHGSWITAAALVMVLGGWAAAREGRGEGGALTRRRAQEWACSCSRWWRASHPSTRCTCASSRRQRVGPATPARDRDRLTRRAPAVGFGDLSPQTEGGRAFASLWLLLAVVATGAVLEDVAAVVVGRQQKRLAQKILTRKMDAEQLMELDEDHSGKVGGAPAAGCRCARALTRARRSRRRSSWRRC